MRHILIGLLAAVLALSLTSCGDLESGSTASSGDAGSGGDSSGDDSGGDDSDDAEAAGKGGGGAPEPEGFGDGDYEVGTDIDPGTYRSIGEGMCYWARVKNFSGDLDSISANGNNAPEIVTLTKKDVGFETQGCGDWVSAPATAPKKPATEFGDGTYQVGVHIRPGTYRSDGEDMCYWARLKDFTHDLESIGANGNDSGIVEISRNDEGFTTFGCGTWTRR